MDETHVRIISTFTCTCKRLIRKSSSNDSLDNNNLVAVLPVFEWPKDAQNTSSKLKDHIQCYSNGISSLPL